MDKKRKSGVVSNIIFFIIIFTIIGITCKIFRENNFNEYTKSEYISKSSQFTRDKDEKVNKYDSYKITSEDFNDAMFYKTISVEENTPYKVICKIKTKNVENKEEKSNGGANICIADTTEKSESIIGTNDWTEIEFLFNSKNRKEVDLGFRLGSYDDNTKGEAWFSDFEIIKGIETSDTNWKMGLFIFENMKIDSKGIDNQMSQNEINTLVSNMGRYEKSIKEISNNQISITPVIYKITQPITSISYDEENGYYVDPLDVSEQIKEIVEKEKFDHIYVAMKLGNIQKENSNTIDWIGLRRNAI